MSLNQIEIYTHLLFSSRTHFGCLSLYNSSASPEYGAELKRPLFGRKDGA